MYALDRVEAPERALFDDSKPACLARRYESEASRGFFRAWKEFRRVEAEFASNAQQAPAKPTPAPIVPSNSTPTPPITAVPPSQQMGSFREMPEPADRRLTRAFANDISTENPVVRGNDGLPLSIGRPLPTTR